ncbi:uncharacterized protein J4E79_009203 [Alternaria viburni]|uniref:uncharacterized protein n=1 Tax=Alternaria viburni TaxID=566460 RepID=UPI0020C4608E|nr:uncharacterized protein J4E79_009203 [Alternaria viburni]KAI4651722.1 hypothetical protein J4E79_009203 [Alternaria viburni]
MPVTASPNDGIMNATGISREPNVWIGYTKHARNYLDKQAKAPNTEQQIRHLKEFYKQHFSSTERVMLRWLWCQRPVVQICEIIPT